MRALVHRLFFAAVVAGPFGLAQAQAQTVRQQAAINVQMDQLRAREVMAGRQMVGVENQLSSRDAQLRAEQSLADVQAHSYSPAIPVIPGAPPAFIDTSQLASIPDDKLAASNERVREAAANRH